MWCWAADRKENIWWAPFLLPAIAPVAKPLYAGSGRRWRFGTGRGGDAHIHGEGAGAVCFDHHSRWSTRPGNAADCDERSAGGHYDSVGAVLSSRFPVLSGEVGRFLTEN